MCAGGAAARHAARRGQAEPGHQHPRHQRGDGGPLLGLQDSGPRRQSGADQSELGISITEADQSEFTSKYYEVKFDKSGIFATQVARQL